MRVVWRFFKLAARAAGWRKTPDPPLVGLPFLLVASIVVIVARIALQLLDAGSWHAFNPYGLNAVVAWLAIELAIAASFVRPAGRATAVSAMFLLSTTAEIVAMAIKLGLALLAPAAAQFPWWNSETAQLGLFAVTVGWWIGAASCVVQS